MSPIIAEDDDFSVGKVGSEPLPYCTVIVSKPASFARCANSLQQTTSTNLSNDVVPTVTNIDFIECCCDRWLVCYKCKCLLYISFVIHFFFVRFSWSFFAPSAVVIHGRNGQTQFFFTHMRNLIYVSTTVSMNWLGIGYWALLTTQGWLRWANRERKPGGCLNFCSTRRDPFRPIFSSMIHIWYCVELWGVACVGVVW